MRARSAALGSFAWFIVAPGVVVGLIPWMITRWRPAEGWSPGVGMNLLSLGLIGAGMALLAPAFIRFVSEGHGTPAPAAPTTALVVGGAYRFVRNPMYLGVFAAIAGQGLLLGQAELWWYLAIVALITAVFVHGYEEPTLRHTFGAAYAEYARNVPAWVPRATPWKPSKQKGRE